jgi:hypothetical protein
MGTLMKYKELKQYIESKSEKEAKRFYKEFKEKK